MFCNREVEFDITLPELQSFYFDFELIPSFDTPLVWRTIVNTPRATNRITPKYIENNLAV